MNPLAQLMALRDLSEQGAVDYVGGGTPPRPITGYGRLKDVEAITSKERGLQFVLQDGSVRLVYVSGKSLPDGLDNDVLVSAFGTGETLRSRQGRTAELHVIADQGLAWSEADGEIGFVEIFPPTTFDRYRAEIYQEPPAFRQ